MDAMAYYTQYNPVDRFTIPDLVRVASAGLCRYEAKLDLRAYGILNDGV
jgi:hypothetical protein